MDDFDDDFCFYNNNTRNATKEYPNLEENVLYNLIWGTVYTWLFAIAELALECCTKKSKTLNRFIHQQHISCGVIHLSLLTLYYNLSGCYSGLLYESITFLSLMIPVWTACAAWNMFLHTFLFLKGEDLYSKKGILKYTTISIAIIQMYEQLIIFLLSLMYCFLPEMGHVVVPAVQTTTILLVMGLTSEIFLVILFFTLISSNVNRKQSFSFILHLFLLQLSDSMLVWFRIDVWRQQIDGHDSDVSTDFLYIRLILEIIWFIVVPYTRLPIYGHNTTE